MRQLRKSSVVLCIVIILLMTGCTQLSLARIDSSQRQKKTSSASYIGFGEGELTEAPKSQEQSRNHLLFTKVQLARSEGNFELAANLLETLLESEPDNAEGCRQYALLNIEMNQYDEAEQYFIRAITSEPRNPKINNDFGYYCYLEQRWEEAKHFLNAATKLDPNLLEAKTNLGLLHARLGDLTSAREFFEQSGCSEEEIEKNLAFASPLNSQRRRFGSTSPDSLSAGLEFSSTAEDHAELIGHRF